MLLFLLSCSIHVFSSYYCFPHVIILFILLFHPSYYSIDLVLSPDTKIAPETVARLDDTYVGVIVGVLVAVVLLSAIVFVFVFRRRRGKFNGSPHKLFGMNHMNFNLDDLTPAMANGKLSNGNMYNSIATMEDKEMKGKGSGTEEGSRDHDMQHRTLPVPPASDDRTLIFLSQS